jgi:cytochrome c6
MMQTTWKLETARTLISILLICCKDVTAFGNPWHSSKSSMMDKIMVAQTKICAGAFILSASCIIAPLPALGGDIAKGEELFVKNCASCHIGGSNLVNEKRTLKKDALEKFGIGLDQESIQNFVTNNGRHKNLVFFKMEGGKLNPTQWEDVTTYISDQAIGEKW